MRVKVVIGQEGRSALEQGKRGATQGREDYNSQGRLLPEDQQSKRD